MSDCEKKLITQVDLARQATILTGNTACFDGKIQAGIPFSGYPTGVDVDSIVLLNPNDGDLQTAIFSGNSLFSNYNVTDPTSPNFIPSYLSGITTDEIPYSSLTWTNPLYTTTATQIPVGITPNTSSLGGDGDPFITGITTFLNSTITVGPFWDITLSGTNGTHNIALEYSGYSIEYNFNVDTANASGATLDPLDISGDGTVGVLNGVALSAQTFTANTGFISATYLEFSAKSLDYTGPLDYLRSREDATIDNKLTTDKIRIRDGASLGTIGYVLTQDEEDGTGVWAPAAGGSGGTIPNYINTASTTETVGGILAGNTFPPPGRTMQQMWDQLLYPYQPPSFTSFNRADLKSVYEVGETITTGSKNFTWSTSNSVNVESGIAGSIEIKELDPSATIANSEDNDGSQTVTTTAAMGRTTVGSKNLYQIFGINTQGGTFNRTISRTWKIRWYFGKNVSATLNATQMQSLAGGGLVSSVVNSYVTQPATAGGEYMYWCIPNTLGQPSDIRDSVAGCFGNNIPFIELSTITITNPFTVSVTYRIYRSVNQTAAAFTTWLCN